MEDLLVHYNLVLLELLGNLEHLVRFQHLENLENLELQW